LDDLCRDVPRLGDLVGAGTRRQLDDHTRDYVRATARLTAEARAGLDRRTARAREQITQRGELIGERARGRLHDARRDARHATELITARDFRRRGWVLASAGDQPVRSAAHLRDGQPVTLDFHDGRAHAIVDHYTTEQEQNP
jgi:exonuclease VII large subunit